MLVNGYKDLSYLNGMQVEYISGLQELYEHPIPDYCTFIKDYGNTVLIGLHYGDYTRRRMFPKGAMLCGDIKFRANTLLVGREIGNYGG